VSKIGRKKLTENKDKRDKLILKFHEEDPTLSIRKIAEKVEQEGIKCGKDTVRIKIKNLPQNKKQIEAYEESTSVVQDDSESHQLEIAKDVIRQLKEDLERAKRFTKDDIRALGKKLENFPSGDLINMIFGHYKHDAEKINVVFESLGLDKSLTKDFSNQEGFFRMCDFIIAQKHEIKEFKAKVKSQSSITENKVLNPIDNQRLEDLEQRIEDLTAENRAKDKRIEELESETPNKDVLLQQNDKINEELTKKLDETLKQNEKLTKELDNAKKCYDDLVAMNKERDIRLIEMNNEIDVLRATIKTLETKSPFNSSSKSKRKSKTSNLRGRQTILGEVT